MTTINARQNFEGYVGAGLDLDLVITEGGAVRDITTDTITFTMRRFEDDAAATVTKTSDDITEINVTDAAAGECRVILKQADTTSLEATTYHWSVSVTNINARKFIVVDGCITFSRS